MKKVPVVISAVLAVVLAVVLLVGLLLLGTGLLRFGWVDIPYNAVTSVTINNALSDGFQFAPTLSEAVAAMTDRLAELLPSANQGPLRKEHIREIYVSPFLCLSSTLFPALPSSCPGR